MPCSCLNDDPRIALDALRAATTLRVLIDESHFIVSTRRCPLCGRCFLSIFTETIDWADGDDPQVWTCVPLESHELDRLHAAADREPITEDHLLGLSIRRRILVRRAPKAQPESADWAVRDLTIPPHD
ncbi:MAG: hypothetical protein JNM80_08750 [Phycisphaerae bacterium]|nr:hypothetical protein [Phycisphaerae bacterium]